MSGIRRALAAAVRRGKPVPVVVVNVSGSTADPRHLADHIRRALLQRAHNNWRGPAK